MSKNNVKNIHLNIFSKQYLSSFEDIDNISELVIDTQANLYLLNDNYVIIFNRFDEDSKREIKYSIKIAKDYREVNVIRYDNDNYKISFIPKTLTRSYLNMGFIRFEMSYLTHDITKYSNNELYENNKLVIKYDLTYQGRETLQNELIINYSEI